MEPTNRPEATLKEVLSVLMAPDGTDQQANALRQMALRCPLDDGFGVYMARAAMISVEGVGKRYMNECEYGPVPDPKGKPNEGIALNSLTIYPNPSHGQFNVEYRLLEGQIGRLELIEPVGRRVASYNLNSVETNTNIDARSFSAGTYLIRLVVDNAVVAVHQAVITK